MPKLRHRKRRLAITTAVFVVATASCTPEQIQMWQEWHSQDPAAAEAFASTPEIQAELSAGVVTSADQIPEVGADGTGTPGDCRSYQDDMAAAGLPVATFTKIGRRETGCDPYAWVVDSDDVGGAFFGLNFKGSVLANHWRNLCGATTGNIRGNVPLIMECASAQYHKYGLSAWGGQP